MIKILKKAIFISAVVLMLVMFSSVSFALESESAEAYSITYELNKGLNSEENPDTYIKGQTVTLSEPTRENHVFKGWYLEKTFKTSVTEISAETEGDITLYAKWNLAPLNINGEGTEDMIWSWWYYPQVVSSGRNVFYGYSTSEGFCGVAKYDGETGKTERTTLKCVLPADDHNGLSVNEMDDGRIMCVYAGGHNNNNEIHIRISDEAGSIKSFTKHIVLESAGKTCYSQVLRYNGEYFVFYRVNNHSWAYRSSEDGENWSEETILIKTTMQYYCRFMPTTKDGLFRICMYSNPREDDPNIRMGFFDVEKKVLLNSDTVTELGTNRVSQEKFDVLIECAEGTRQRLFDVAITEPLRPLILYTVFTSQNKANDSVYYLYDSGNIQKICDGGIPIMSNNYQCGAAFAGRHQIASIRNEDGKDIVELYDYSEGEITLQREVYTKETGENHHRNGRPIVDINGKVFIWHEGYYNPQKYTDFLTSARTSLEFSDSTDEENVLHLNCDKATRGFVLTEIKEATCITEGAEIFSCSCGASFSKVIPIGKHTEEKIPAVKATYTKEGLTEGKKCTVCGEITVPQKTVSRKRLSEVKGIKVNKTTVNSVTLSWKKVKGADSYKVYYSTDGKKWKSVKTEKTTLTVKKLTSGTTYRFKVKAFVEKFYGTIGGTVKTATKVKKAVLSSVKSPKLQTATVVWKAVYGASGYTVEYSTSKKFSKKATKKITVKKRKASKTTLKNLKSGKTYYVRVKAYKVVNGNMVYGNVSKAKTVNIK